MLSQFQDALLPILSAGAVGLLIGAGLVWGLSRRGRTRAAGDGKTRMAGRAGAASGMHAAVTVDAGMPKTRSGSAAGPLLPQAADLLVVDDSAVARAKLRRLFEAAGYHVEMARDGLEALALLEKGRYALMISDLEMPNMDGVTLINTCLGRPHTARMPILAISGHESLRAKFNECRDVCGVHRKPWVDDILLSHVATLVTTRRAREATSVA